MVKPKKTLGKNEFLDLCRAFNKGKAQKVMALIVGTELNVEHQKPGVGFRSPLILAVENDDPKIVSAMLAAGADPNFALENGSRPGATALHYLCSAGVASLLIKAGGDVNRREKEDDITPLHRAVSHADSETIECLINSGADVNAKTKDGATPYDRAPDNATRKLLQAHGAKGASRGNGLPISSQRVAASANDIKEPKAIGIDASGSVWIAEQYNAFCIGRGDYAGAAIGRYEMDLYAGVSPMVAHSDGSLSLAADGLVQHLNGGWRRFSFSDSDLHSDRIEYLVADREGRAFALSRNDWKDPFDAELSIFDGKSFNVMSLDEDLEMTCLAFDEKNRMLVGTRSGVRFPDGGRYPAKAVSRMRVIGETLWVGADKDVHMVNLKTKKGKKIRVGREASCFCAGDGGVFVGMRDGGITFIDEAGTEKKIDWPFEKNDVWDMVRDGNGVIWFVSYSFGVGILQDGVIRKLGEKAAPPASKAAESKTLKPLPPPIVSADKLPKKIVEAVREQDWFGFSADMLLGFLRPAIALKIGKPSEVAVGNSKFGGAPDLPNGVAWPMHKKQPLAFVLQVKLSDVAAHDIEGLLPKDGVLSFFAQLIPDELAHWHVMYSATKKLKRHAFPQEILESDDDNLIASLPEYALAPSTTWTRPSNRHLQTFFELASRDRTGLEEIDKLLDKECTRLLGWPSEVQGAVLQKPTETVLLQLAADTNAKGFAGMFRQWGDGIAHYVVTQKHLQEKDFSKTRAELSFT